METIFKYEIDPHVSGIRMPAGAEVLSVAFQGEKFCLWVKVNPDAETELRSFVACGTGHKIPSGELKFIGTGHMDNGLVFHAFERLGL